MKRTVLITLFLLNAAISYAQVSYDNETFPYNGFNVGHYGLWWYQDPATTNYGPMAYLSAFGGIKFFTTGGPKAVLDANGNFGIWTMTPQANVEVKAPTAFDGRTSLRITNNSGDYGRTNLILTGRIQENNDAWNFGSLARNSIVFSENESPSGQNVGGIGDEKYSIQLEGNTNALGFLSKANGTSPNMVLLQSGNVLIGKTTQANPAYKLDVAGFVRASRVVVNTTGADFVFTPDYNLPPLAKVDDYIKANHHLPDIPSATQMQSEGMDVGELNKRLLQKIEELTLYLIEKDKSEKRMKTLITQQQKRLSHVEYQLKHFKNLNSH